MKKKFTAGIMALTLIIPGASDASDLIISTAQSDEFNCTKGTRLSGNTVSGQGTLKVEMESFKTGTYSGQCRDNLPHGNGTVQLDNYQNEGNQWIRGRMISGTWKRGLPDGIMTITAFERNPYGVTRMVGRYNENGPVDEARYYTGSGVLVFSESYAVDEQARKYRERSRSSNPLISKRAPLMITGTTVYENGKPFVANYDPGYIRRIAASVDRLSVGNFHLAMLRDHQYYQKLTSEQALAEIDALQEAIDARVADRRYVPEFGISIYEPVKAGALRLLIMMHATRIELLKDFRYGMHLASPYGIKLLVRLKYGYQCPLFDFYLMNDCTLFNTSRSNWPSAELVIETFRHANLPREVTKNTIIVLMPYSWTVSNGYAQSEYVVCFGRDPYPYGTSPSLVMHEFGHSVEFRMLTDDGRQDWWKLREVPQSCSGIYDARHTFVEDFRILFSQWDKADYRRPRPGLFCDIRDYPEKKEKVHRFIKELLDGYRSVGVSVPQLLYGRVFRPQEALEIMIDEESGGRYKIVRGSNMTNMGNEDSGKLKQGKNRIPISDLDANCRYTLEVRSSNGTLALSRVFYVIK